MAEFIVSVADMSPMRLACVPVPQIPPREPARADARLMYMTAGIPLPSTENEVSLMEG